MSTSAPGPRVTGLETEFGLLCAPAGPSEATKSDLPDVERAAALIFRHRPVGYRSTNLFLPNCKRPTPAATSASRPAPMTRKSPSTQCATSCAVRA